MPKFGKYEVPPDGFTAYSFNDGWSVVWFLIDAKQQKAIDYYQSLYDDFDDSFDIGDTYVEFEFAHFDVRVYDSSTHQGIQVKWSYHWNSQIDMTNAIEQYNGLLEAMER